MYGGENCVRKSLSADGGFLSSYVYAEGCSMRYVSEWMGDDDLATSVLLILAGVSYDLMGDEL